MHSTREYITYFQKLSDIIKKAPQELYAEIQRHIDYISLKSGYKTEAILEGSAIKNIHPQLLTDAVANISSVLGCSPEKGSRALFQSTAYAPIMHRYIELLKPALPNNVRLQRYGNINDGGYVLIHDFPQNTLIYSIGIADDVSFDMEMAKMGFKVKMFDHTISQLPDQHELFEFTPKGIAAKDAPPQFVSLKTILNTIDNSDKNNFVLKMDIEGGEWDVLRVIDENILLNFRQIVLELHGMTDFESQENTQKRLSSLKMLNQSHQVIHIHANNNAPYEIISGIPFPDVLEVSYARRSDFGQFSPSGEVYPIQGLDRPNVPFKADYSLPFWGGKKNDLP